jgi:hypothetical protein
MWILTKQNNWSNFLYLANIGQKWDYNGTVHQLFIDFKKAYDSVRRKVLYNILTEFGIPRKLAGPIKMCLNDTYTTVHISKILDDKFPIQSGVKQVDTLSTTTFQLCFVIYH